MKVVDAKLSTGETILIKEQWFIQAVENGSDWRDYAPVTGEAGPMKMKVNPKFIVWLRLLDFAS